ncbi:MAG TPA: beta-N-acetylhexosaminidase [Pyrinomonadaceae bacterium]|nr:beta-N-acetylhexosaminidase [Pyrinomonadaceae bacterium]
MANTLTRSLGSRLIVVSLILLLVNVVVRAQAPAGSASIAVLPKPRQVTANGESFALDRGVHLRLADPKSADDRFAAVDFIDDVKQTSGIELRLSGGNRRREILIGKLDLPAIESVLKKRGISLSESLGDEGYLLDVRKDGVVIAATTATGVFYGLQTLKQLVRGDSANGYIQGVHIVDWPAMRWRGMSDDISRGPVPTLSYIKRQLRTFASFKLNVHSFYMEHTLASDEHPLIAPEGGSLTPAEIKELVAYARSYHIELIPEQQTFGHLHKALKLEKYNSLAETPYGDVLSPQQEGSYKLIADWYRELDQLFPGQFFHIGADETFELGEGQSMEAAKAKGVGAVYFDHLDRVRELLKPYNRKLIFWGDIALNHPDLIGDIPKDLIVANWDYAPRESYNSRIEPFKKAGLQQLVCPGIWSWNQIFPNIESSSKNIINFVRDAQTAGAIGMLNTSWDDDGESLFEMSWYGVVLGAAASWQSQPFDQNGFDADFDWAFFRTEGQSFVSAIRALGSVNATLGGGAGDEAFWRNPFSTAFQTQVRANSDKIRQMRLQVENAEESIIRNRTRVRRNGSMIPAMIFAAQRFDHLGRRAQTIEKFSREYWDAYLNLGDRARARRLRRYTGAIYNHLREMAEELAELKVRYREQWLTENRPYWLESVLSRYDQAISIWLAKSRAMDDALRVYDTTSILPDPEEFGLGTR